MNREWKGNMQRRFDRRLWPFILSLLLACGSVSVPTHVRADIAAGGDAPGTPPPDAGDPDWPTSPPPSRNVKPGPGKGAISPIPSASPTRANWVTWLKWTIRMAYGSTWRVFFRV